MIIKFILMKQQNYGIIGLKLEGMPLIMHMYMVKALWKNFLVIGIEKETI